MTTMVSTKCLSLVEQKRIQWAKEREELAGLCAPWGPPSTRRDENYRTCIRTRFVTSTSDLREEESHKQEEVSRSYDYSELTTELQAAAARMRRRRSPSLPPIYSRTAPTCQDEDSMRSSHQYGTNPDQEEEGEGETSGYASDSGGTSNERTNDYWNQQRQDRYHRQDNWMSDCQRYEKMSRRYSKHSPWIPSNGRRYGSPESVMSTPPYRLWSSGAGSDEVNRMRWGDRGVGVGHLWEPTLHEPDSRLPQVQGSGRGTPGWLERGLNKLSNSESSMGSTQVLVINHGSPEQSPLSRELAGSCDTISIQSQSECSRTFIRGQNAPLEPEVLMERERKRQKALEHQNAIRLQLEERERKRKEEKERRIREERDEEERIKREQEIERKRIEDEQRKLKEREDKEVRKAAAMREALENAEKKAREEKSRASRKHVLESVKNINNVCAPVDTTESKSWFETSSTAENPTTLTKPKTLKVKESVSSVCQETSSSSVPVQHQDVQRTNDGTQTGPETHNEALLIAAETVAMPADGLAVVLGNTTEGNSHDMLTTPGGGVQLALLMSPSLPQPLMLDNRLLTPSKYRSVGRERGTQTDSEIVTAGRNRRIKDKMEARITRKDRKKSASLERPHRGCKLPLRCRSQSQPTQPRIRLEDRPKWGVNRPGTQYIKQSEKDPYYQRRLRQRLLRAAMMGGGDTGTESDTGSHRRPRHARGSSDENSRSPSPQQGAYNSNNKSSTGMTNNIYYHHVIRSSDGNINNLDEQDEKCVNSAIVNEQLDNKNTVLRDRNYAVGTPSKRVQVVVPSSNINGLAENAINRKTTRHGSSHKISSSTKRLLNRQNERPATIDSGIGEQWSTAHDILSQLSSLRQGLIMKQQEWDSTRSHTPYSESSWNS
ncbi:coiled-coil domain-containing protein 66 [Periplaneta americana]|uniref:coiled-coil domain-containing protein 66 n=1 Tax=Periplaneta americana TaxID=6978 RepID=UPI0037E79F13